MKMKHHWPIAALLLSLCMTSSAYAANFPFKYQSPDGSIVYSDQELPSPFRLLEKKEIPNQLLYSGAIAGPMAKGMQRRRDNYASLVSKASERHKLDEALVHAVIEAESAYMHKAVSHAGAQGLMQLMPGTAKRFGVSDSFDPAQNIRGGTRYLAYLLGYYKNDLKLAVAAYNAGENAVDRYGKQIPPYKETQGYVEKVLKYYRRNLKQAIDESPRLSQNAL